MGKRYNVAMGAFDGAGTSIRFRPKGRVTCHDDADTAEEAVRTRYGAGGFAARIFVGLSVGEDATYTVDDVVSAVVEARKAQGAGPDASILSQRGIYEDKQNRTIIEDSVQVVILDLAGLKKKEFTDQMLDVAEALLEEFEQETVIVEIQKKGVTTDVYGVTP